MVEGAEEEVKSKCLAVMAGIGFACDESRLTYFRCDNVIVV
jgi:hypothetical protein